MECIIPKKRSSNKIKKKHLNSDLEIALKLSIHDFSFSFYEELLAKTETGNIFYSPLGIYAVMFNASVGANSKTFDEIITVLHLNQITYSQKAYCELLEKLTSENYNLKVINGMFVDSVFNIKKSFMEKSWSFFKLSVEKLNFKNDIEAERQYINNWVLDKTYNIINDLFPTGSITKVNNFVLVNVVCFKSAWEYKFKDTVEDNFYVTPTNKIIVKMMVLKRFLQYYHDIDLKFAALTLPYEHHAFKMIIILPDEKDGLKNIEDNIQKVNVYDIINKMSGYHVNVKIPRFKMEQSIQTEGILTNLGCPTMFTLEANFSNVVDHGGLYVSNVVHKACADVNERGIDDVTCTGIRFVQYQPRRLQPKANFVADHPFIFFIISNTATILFMGRVSQP